MTMGRAKIKDESYWPNGAEKGHESNSARFRDPNWPRKGPVQVQDMWSCGI